MTAAVPCVDIHNRYIDIYDCRYTYYANDDQHYPSTLNIWIPLKLIFQMDIKILTTCEILF